MTPELPEPDMHENGDDGTDSGPITAMPDLEPLATAMPSLKSQSDELPECVPSEKKISQPQRMHVQMQGQTTKRSKPTNRERNLRLRSLNRSLRGEPQELPLETRRLAIKIAIYTSLNP